MNIEKRNALVEQLSAESEPLLVPIARFLEGNDDLGSIGCNLREHPGIDAFRKVFEAVARRPDVVTILAQIAELDPGAESWPFADTVYVVGRIPEKELKSILTPLQPDEVGPASAFDVPAAVTSKYPEPVLVAWWD